MATLTQSTETISAVFDGRIVQVEKVQDDRYLVDGNMVEADKLQLLPQPGERVTIDGQEHVWVSAHRMTYKGLTVGLLADSSPMLKHLSSEQLDGLTRYDTPRLDGQALTIARAACETLARNETWLEGLVADAHEWADNNSLCSNFDYFMEEHGLEPRTREYQARITITLDIDVEGRDFEAATGHIDREWIAHEIAPHYRHWDWEVREN